MHRARSQQAVQAAVNTTLAVLKPKTNSIASITLDLPLPFGPTTDVKFCITVDGGQTQQQPTGKYQIAALQQRWSC